jgi:hypothetical protein
VSAPAWRAAVIALRIGRANPANEAMSNTIGVNNRLWTNANALRDPAVHALISPERTPAVSATTDEDDAGLKMTRA